MVHVLYRAAARHLLTLAVYRWQLQGFEVMLEQHRAFSFNRFHTRGTEFTHCTSMTYFPPLTASRSIHCASLLRGSRSSCDAKPRRQNARSARLLLAAFTVATSVSFGIFPGAGRR